MEKNETWGDTFAWLTSPFSWFKNKGDVNMANHKKAPATKDGNSVNELSMYRTKDRELMMWFSVIVQQVLFIYIVTLSIHISIGLSWGWSAIIAGFVWVIVFCFMGGIDLFFVNTAPFHGCVLINRFRSDEKPRTDLDSIDLKPTKVLEEVGQGVHPKLMWQKPVYIDLRKQITVEMPLTTYSSDGIEFKIKAIMIVSAIRGYLCNLVRNTEEEAQDILQGKAESQLIAQISKTTQDNLLKKINKLESWFGNIFDGDEKLSTLEKQCGLTATNLTINAPNRSKKFQESAEALMIAENTALAVKKLRKAGGAGKDSIGGKQALDAVLASEGTADYRAIHISGLENLTHVGGNFPIDLGDRKNKKGDK